MMDWIPVIESGSRVAGLLILAVMPLLTLHGAGSDVTVYRAALGAVTSRAAWRVNVVRWTRTSPPSSKPTGRRLQSVAYRMLGSLTEAEDAVQETWIRLSRSDSESIDNLGGWLTTVLSRVCLGVLRSRRTHPKSR